MANTTIHVNVPVEVQWGGRGITQLSTDNKQHAQQFIRRAAEMGVMQRDVVVKLPKGVTKTELIQGAVFKSKPENVYKQYERDLTEQIRIGEKTSSPPS